VWAKAASAGTTADLIEAGIESMVFDGRSAALKLATRTSQLAVHVMEMETSGTFVKIVNVLRAKKVAARNRASRSQGRSARDWDLPYCPARDRAEYEGPDTGGDRAAKLGCAKSSTRNAAHSHLGAEVGTKPPSGADCQHR